MKAETPAQGISVDRVFKDAIAFNIECNCGGQDHDVKMWIEVDGITDIKEVEVTFYVTTWTPYFTNFWNRLRIAYNVLVHGVHEEQHSLFLNQQSALNLSAAIAKTVKKLAAKK